MLPGVVPRLRAFAADGFSWMAALMASIYAAVGLLPPTHPYLNSANVSRFGMRHVMMEAGRNLKFDRHHIDQVIIYFTLMTGFVLIIAQIAILAFGLIFHPAMAGPPFLGLFVTPNPTNDVAFMLLDRVFAVPQLYGSQFDPDIIGTTPFSDGLQALFQFYSQAMLIVGVFILLYYVVILVAETAQTGTPFGKRFDSVWAPIRLVVAIGLLVPVNYGYNSAQYIVLYAAKFGSSFATNSWNIYNDAVAAAGVACTTGGSNNAMGVCDESLVAVPRSQDVIHLIQFMSIARSCKTAYETVYRRDNMTINPYLVRQTATGPENQLLTAGPNPTWQQAIEFYNYGDITIVFGQANARHNKFTGQVKPFCGEIVVPTTTADASQQGPALIQAMYYGLIIGMWGDARFDEFARKVNSIYLEQFTQQYGGPCSNQISIGDVGPCVAGGGPPATIAGINNGMPSSEFGQQLKTAYYTASNAILQAGRNVMIGTTDYTVTAQMRERGWGGAGIWYNQIAEWNGSLFGAAINIPTPKSMPLVMKQVETQKSSSDQNMQACKRYEPFLATKDRQGDIKIDAEERPIANMLSGVYQYWRCKNPTEKTDNKASGNIFFDTLSAIFGLNGLFTIRENATVHPMAQLSGIGRSIVESAIRNLMSAMTFSFMGGMLEILGTQEGGAFHQMSGMFVTLTTMGLSIGFILYYVLPFLPFMYFFFAVGSWVKSIFEAMVGVPLWALAHLKIDGHGLHGDTALNGYFLIFEIFVRPILTVFGLLASMAIFAAMVKTLNGIFPMVTANLTGFDTNAPKVKGVIQGIEFKRAIVDEFFFTLIYTVVVYMLALSSFKMIDLVPNNILRWMGHGVHTFSESSEQSMNQFIQYAAIGGSSLTGQAAKAATGLSRTVGNVAGFPLLGLSKLTAAKQNSQAVGTPVSKGGPSAPSATPKPPDD